MARSKHDSAQAASNRLRVKTSRAPQIAKTNRLKDAVYREMYLLESNRPGAEMGLALALLRAIVHSKLLAGHEDFPAWLSSVCPLALQMIETSLEGGSRAAQESTYQQYTTERAR